MLFLLGLYDMSVPLAHDTPYQVQVISLPSVCGSFSGEESLQAGRYSRSADTEYQHSGCLYILWQMLA